MRNLSVLTLVALVCLVPVGAWGQAGSFTIAQHGKPVGTAEYNFMSTPHGYSSTSVVRIAMQGLNYALSKTESLSPANHLRHVQVSATVNNSAVNLTADSGCGAVSAECVGDGKELHQPTCLSSCGCISAGL